MFHAEDIYPELYCRACKARAERGPSAAERIGRAFMELVQQADEEIDHETQMTEFIRLLREARENA